ncbi:MAG: hypothetical protein JHC87_07910, partial [Thermoleophilaceae bacterium]|nr:hypothetical protein [Thermoleophilaceae bacterium]
MITPPTHAACLTGADLDAVPAALERGEFFWLDLQSSSDHDIAQAGDLLGIHPLAVEDSQHFGQRPKFEQYKDHC